MHQKQKAKAKEAWLKGIVHNFSQYFLSSCNEIFFCFIQKEKFHPARFYVKVQSDHIFWATKSTTTLVHTMLQWYYTVYLSVFFHAKTWDDLWLAHVELTFHDAFLFLFLFVACGGTVVILYEMSSIKIFKISFLFNKIITGLKWQFENFSKNVLSYKRVTLNGIIYHQCFWAYIRIYLL